MKLLYLLSKCVYATIGPIYTLQVAVKSTTIKIDTLVFATYTFIMFKV